MAVEEKKWQRLYYSASDILELGIERFQLLNAVKAGKLTPYNRDSGNTVIDLNTAEKIMAGEFLSVLRIREFTNED